MRRQNAYVALVTSLGVEPSSQARALIVISVPALPRSITAPPSYSVPDVHVTAASG